MVNVESRNPEKTFGFGLRALKKHYAVAPLVGIISFAVVGTAIYSIYAFKKTDVVVNRNADLPPWERVDFEKPQKLVTINQEYKRNPELEALKKDMAK